MSGNPDRVLNLTHRDDAASAILGILQSEDLCGGEIFNAVMVNIPPVERLSVG